MEVTLPNYIKYDFLGVILGLGMAIYGILYTNDISKIILVSSIPVLIYSLGEMYRNYQMENDVITLHNIIQQKKAMEELKKLNMLSEHDENYLNFFLKGQLNEMIDKKFKQKKS